MPTNFNDSFRWRAPLRANCKHGWEHHAHTGTLVRALLARLDYLAAKDKGRFVFATLPALLKMCNKGRAKADCYSLVQLKKALAEFRARHIVSPYFTRWDGQYGFVMEPHVAGKGRAHLVDNVCVLDAYRDERPLDETSQGSPHDAPKRGHAGDTQGTRRGHSGDTQGTL